MNNNVLNGALTRITNDKNLIINDRTTQYYLVQCSIWNYALDFVYLYSSTPISNSWFAILYSSYLRKKMENEYCKQRYSMTASVEIVKVKPAATAALYKKLIRLTEMSEGKTVSANGLGLYTCPESSLKNFRTIVRKAHICAIKALENEVTFA